MKAAAQDGPKRRPSMWFWFAAVFVLLMAVFGLYVASNLPPPPDEAVFDVLVRNWFMTVAERDNLKYGRISGDFVYEKEEVTQGQVDSLTRDFDRLLKTTASTYPITSYGWLLSSDPVYEGFGGFEPIKRIRLIDGHYDRGDTKGQRILMVVVSWEGRRDNLWDRFRKWAHI